MPRKQNSTKRLEWKELLATDGDFLRPLVQAVLQEVLEAEMTETLQAGKSERTDGSATGAVITRGA